MNSPPRIAPKPSNLILSPRKNTPVNHNKPPPIAPKPKVVNSKPTLIKSPRNSNIQVKSDEKVLSTTKKSIPTKEEQNKPLSPTNERRKIKSTRMSKRKFSLASLARKNKSKGSSEMVNIIQKDNSSSSPSNESKSHKKLRVTSPIPKRKQKSSNSNNIEIGKPEPSKKIESNIDTNNNGTKENIIIQNNTKNENSKEDNIPVELIKPQNNSDNDLITLDKPETKQCIISKDPRENIVQELYYTEIGYIQDLQIIVNLYILPLRENQIISIDDMNKLFSTVEMLLPMHKALEQQLQKTQSVVSLFDKTQKVDNNLTIGKCFISMSEYLKMYTQYCSNQQVSTQHFQYLIKTNNAFENFVYDAKNTPECKQLDLPSYLIKPLQRVCKYPLLLRELIKQTPESHYDYKYLQEAFNVISKIVGIINERKKIMEENAAILILQTKVIYPKKFPREDFPILGPSRTFKKAGSCTYVSKHFKSSIIKWYIFNDLLVITTNRHKLKKYVPLNSAILSFVTLDDYQYTIEIIHCGNDKIWLAQKDDIEKQELSQFLIEAGIIDRSKEAPVISLLHEYSSRPMPIPPGKFEQSFTKQNVSEIIDMVQDISTKEPVTPPVITNKKKVKQPTNFTISSPSNFRRGYNAYKD